MAAPAQLSADQSNKHTDKYQSLYKSRKKSQDGKSSTAMWDYFKPVLIYGDPPAEGQPKPVVGVQVQTLCDKLLSAGNVSNTEKTRRLRGLSGLKTLQGQIMTRRLRCWAETCCWVQPVALC
jgi:hypothetical protein